MSKFCECGNPAEQEMCPECQKLLGTRDFVSGQKVRIIRRETWRGDICTVTRRSERNPNMYWLKEHGWRRSDEIEPVSMEPLEGTKTMVLCCVCGKRPAMHDSWDREHGERHRCCQCYVRDGNPPADWHPLCIQTYREQKKSDDS